MVFIVVTVLASFGALIRGTITLILNTAGQLILLASQLGCVLRGGQRTNKPVEL